MVWGGAQQHQSLPSFGSNAAGPSCDGAVYVGEVGVIPRVVPCANLRIITGKNKMSTCRRNNIRAKLDSTGHLC